jgi:predicted PolB exonuclease-like 3'-5' exonuclease
MRTYILDIETKPGQGLDVIFNKGIKAPKTYKDPEKIADYIEKKKKESIKAMSVDPDYLDIACFGIYDVQTGEAEVYEPEHLSEQMHRLTGGQVITFNGKKFDIPAIIKYGIKYDLDLPYKWLKRACKRYETTNHIDLMEELGEYGSYRSLDEYLQIYLGVEKKEIDFATCTDEELREHCLEDIFSTKKLFDKFRPIFI